jgi:hypothetical protein
LTIQKGAAMDEGRWAARATVPSFASNDSHEMTRQSLRRKIANQLADILAVNHPFCVRIGWREDFNESSGETTMTATLDVSAVQNLNHAVFKTLSEIPNNERAFVGYRSFE